MPIWNTQRNTPGSAGLADAVARRIAGPALEMEIVERMVAFDVYGAKPDTGVRQELARRVAGLPRGARVRLGLAEGAYRLIATSPLTVVIALACLALWIAYGYYRLYGAL